MAQAKVTTIFGADITQLQQATTQAGQSLQKFGNDNVKAIGGMIAGAFTVGSLISFGKQAMETAGQIADMSASLQISTDALQGLVALGKDNGLDQEKLFMGLAKLKDLQISLLDGGKAGEEAAKKLEKFGITAKDAISMELSDLLEQIAIGAKDNVESFTSLNDVFGKTGGKDFTNMLNELADNGLKNVIERYRELGLVIDNDFIGSLDRAGDAMERAQTKIGNKLVILGGTLANFFNDAGSVFYTGLFKTWDDLTSGKIDDMANAITGVSAIKGTIDGVKGVMNDEIGSGAERKLAEKTEAERKAKEEKGRIERTNKMEADSIQNDIFDFIDRLEKDMVKEMIAESKAKKDIEKLDSNYEKDVLKINEQGIKMNVSEAVSLGRLNGGNSYQIALAERQLKVDEDIRKLTEKHIEETIKVQVKLDE